MQNCLISNNKFSKKQKFVLQKCYQILCEIFCDTKSCNYLTSYCNKTCLIYKIKRKTK